MSKKAPQFTWAGMRELGLNYDDEVTLAFLDKLAVDNTSIESAVTSAIQEKGPDPDSGAELKYFPDQGGKATLAGLLNSN